MRRVSCAVFIAALWGCENGVTPTPPRDSFVAATAVPTYTVVRLPTLGGRSQGGSIANSGAAAGYSGVPDGTRHASLWQNGSIKDLGTLGGMVRGLHSAVQWPGQNNSGMIVGISHTPALDTLGEDWSCSAFIAAIGHVCLGFVWQADVMSPLPTLGGENGFATGVNSRGEIVGWAETPVHDPTCNVPQVLQFRAVMWEPAQALMRQLPPLAGDSTSAATAINEEGQAVGISGDCDVAVGRRSARHAVLWANGTVTDLGNLGGQFWHTPMAINNRGDVVGFSNPAGGDLAADNLHAFLWTRAGGMKDLGTLPGDALSEALAINGRDQIVGVSCGEIICRAVVWQNGVIVKLHDLVGPGFSDLLWSARDINDAGQITGRLIEQGTGNAFAFVATPLVATP